MNTCIIRHELRQVVYSRKIWICFAVLQALLALIFNWLLSKYLLNQTMIHDSQYGITEEIIHPYYAWFCLLVLFFIPMLTTQSVCAEKVQKTIINYRMAPITPTEFVLGKFAAINLALTIAILFISILPLTMLVHGTFDWGQFVASLLGTYLILNAAVAIGLAAASFMNSIAKSNVFVFMLLLAFILFEWAAEFTGPYAQFLQTFGLLVPLKSFLAGVINLKHLSYYLCVIVCFIGIAAWRYGVGDSDV